MIESGRISRVVGIVAVGVVATSLAAGCASQRERARLAKEAQALRTDVARLERELAQRDATIASAKAQIETLQGFDAGRPVDLFAPVRIEIVSRSGGQDYDGKPGDDGVTIYVRPKDANGDTVKAPGLLTVQLLDNSNLERPKLIGTYHFKDPQRLRSLWYGGLATNHYTLKCPFPDGLQPPRELNATVAFVDFLTGLTLTATATVTVSPPTHGQADM